MCTGCCNGWLAFVCITNANFAPIFLRRDISSLLYMCSATLMQAYQRQTDLYSSNGRLHCCLVESAVLFYTIIISCGYTGIVASFGPVE